MPSGRTGDNNVFKGEDSGGEAECVCVCVSCTCVSYGGCLHVNEH